METSRKSLYQVSALVVLIIVTLLIALVMWRQKINQTLLIGEEQAIQNAIQACPYIGLQPVEQPTKAEAELATFGTVQGPYNSDPERPVWLVKLQGRWLLVGGPPPPQDSNPEPSYWNECTIIIDARTGKTLTAPIE